jgi:hypothetical protein
MLGGSKVKWSVDSLMFSNAREAAYYIGENSDDDYYADIEYELEYMSDNEEADFCGYTVTACTI